MNIIHLGGTSWPAYENGKGILIDAGKNTNARHIIKRIRTLGLKIPLIFLTHTHYDHARGVEAVRQATGAKVVAGAEELDALKSGYTPVPAGTGRLGRFIVRIAHLLEAVSRDHYPSVREDVIAITEAGELEGFGFDLHVYRLGAHSAGSIGLKIGDAFFAGDTVFGIAGRIYPPFADLPDEFPAAWSAILGSGAKRVYPGHGKPFSITALDRQYRKRFTAK